MKEQEKDIDKQDISAELPAHDAPARGEAKPFQSAGARIHNEITYRAIDWLLNSAVGVGFTYWAKRTPSGHKYFGAPVTNFFKKVIQPFTKNPHTLEEGAKWGSMFASIMAGGTAIIPVMMFSENKKVKKAVIKCLDEQIYGKDKVENDPQFAESYECIDREPRKSFTTGMLARIAAIAPLIAAASTPAINKHLIACIYNPIAKCTKAAAKMVGIKPGRMLTEGAVELVEGTQTKAFQSNWDFLHQTIGFDFGLTIFYAYLHEKAYKAFSAIADRRKRKHEAEGNTVDVAETPTPCDEVNLAPAKSYAQNISKPNERGLTGHTERYKLSMAQHSNNPQAAI